ncbi:hypothetical protein L5515_002188 [Caenorhabditis briggsae]|uniref:C-type lectin domain-containing protein n=1 Tax=Caenorhabditis briggsae TaxID=6238 RepID=A0AAE9E5U8_CAEBR|nr:hypothetical protein L5515_002188 [Caenorhabditis briggsae]
MTKAEMYYIDEIYSEIYPIKVYQDGAILLSASYVTIKQTNLDTNQEGIYTTENLNEKCLGIGRILNIESYPITAIEEEFNDRLQEDGNKKDEQICDAHSFSFNKVDRYPTKSAMRAPIICTLHTFNWMYGACPTEPAWSAPVIRYERKNKKVFCYYINNQEIATRDEAKARCSDPELGASLTGFDSKEEFLKIIEKVKSVYPPESNPDRYLKDGIQYMVQDHYYLGRILECKVECAKGNGENYVASWEYGVGSGTKFLNEYSHKDHDYWEVNGEQYVSFREDSDALHLHPYDDPPFSFFFICGTEAPLIRSERQKGKLAN